jgi:hypothetical protein
MSLADLDDGALVAQLREHIAGDDRVQELLDEISVRLLRHTVFANRSLWVLVDLLHEAQIAAGKADVVFDA